MANASGQGGQHIDWTWALVHGRNVCSWLGVFVCHGAAALVVEIGINMSKCDLMKRILRLFGMLILHNIERHQLHICVKNMKHGK